MSSIGAADAFLLMVVLIVLAGLVTLSVIAGVLGRRRGPRSRTRLALAMTCTLLALATLIGSVMLLAWALQWEVRLTIVVAVVAAAVCAAPVLLAVRAVRRQWVALTP